jgi:hypothetical protein
VQTSILNDFLPSKYGNFRPFFSKIYFVWVTTICFGKLQNTQFGSLELFVPLQLVKIELELSLIFGIDFRAKPF